MNKYIASLVIVLCACFLGGCSEEANMHKDFSKMLPGRMNLTGAVRVGLKTESSSRAIEGEYASAGLYKVDAAGNISAVGVYFTTDTEGNRLEHEEYLHVAPKKLYNLSQNYMVAFFCEYYDKDGDLVKDDYYKDDVEYYVHKEVPYQHLLIRKTDGKIWCIDNIFRELYSDGIYNLYPRCFLEDPNGVLHTCDGFRFNLDVLFPSYERVFETKHGNVCPNWGILDNGVRVTIGSTDISKGGGIAFRWPQSGFQILSRDDCNSAIKENYKFPLRKDLIVETASYLQNSGKYTELYLEPSVRDEDCLVHITPTGPLLILPLKYVLKGKKLIDGVVVGNDVEVSSQSDFSNLEDWNIRRELKQYINTSCPWFLVFATTVGNTPGSARLNPIREINCLPSTSHTESYYIGSWCSKGDELLINFHYFNKEWHQISARFNIKSLEWKWFMEDVDVHFGNGWWDSKREISYNLIYENSKPIGVKWVNLKTMESGQNLFKITIPDYYKPGHPDENFLLTFSGVNPADGLEGEIKVDITTGEVVSSDIFEKDWALTYLISLN